MPTYVDDVLRGARSHDAIYPDTRGYRVRPRDIDPQNFPDPWEAASAIFGGDRNVFVALTIVRFCQVSNRWGPVKIDKLMAFCDAQAIDRCNLEGLHQMGLLRGAGFNESGITHAFVALCWLLFPPRHLG